MSKAADVSRFQAVCFIAVLASALLLSSCSGSAGPAGGNSSSQQGSESILKGRYALLNSSLVGSLNFDGQGKVNGEVQSVDPVNPGFGLTKLSVSGTYNVGSDGRGATSLKSGAVASRNPVFSFVVLANGDVLFIETDVQSSDVGIMRTQDASSFSFSVLNGTYSLGPLPVNSRNVCPPGGLTLDQAGTFSFAPGYLHFTAESGTPDSFTAENIEPATGNIDVSQTAVAEFTHIFAAYAVSSNEVFAVLTFGGGSTVACQVKRNTGGFSDAALSQAYTVLFPAQLGSFDGNAAATFSVANGTVQSGTIDVAGFLNGTSQQFDQPITSGTFSVNPDGSCSVSLGSILSATCIAVNSDFAFLQAMNAAECSQCFIPGVLARRQLSSFTLNSLAGDFGVVVAAFRRDNVPMSSVARLTFDGSGNVSGLQNSNAGPGFLQNSVVLHGTYAMAPGGRGTMTLNSPVQTSHYAIYLTSVSEFYLVGLDTASESGTGFGHK